MASITKPLTQVLRGVRTIHPVPPDLGSRAVAGLEYDSRRTGEDFLFFAFPGAKVDGRAFAAQAIDQRALAVATDLQAPVGLAAPGIRVEHGRRALATAAKNFYDAPDERIALTGITGTNGKTTTSYLTDS